MEGSGSWCSRPRPHRLKERLMTPNKGYRINLSGRRFGLWTVLCFYGCRERSHSSTWLCKCTCGTIRPVQSCGLLENSSCGCQATNHMTPLRKGWIDDGIGYIPATKEKITRVSPAKVEELQQWHWQASLFPNGKFYIHRWAIDENGNNYRLHMARHILGMERCDKRVADHANLDSLDNRDENLRMAFKTQDAYNKRVRSDSETGIKGVQFDKRVGLYYSHLWHNGVYIYLGSGKTAEEVQKLYIEAVFKLRGEFARAE